MKARINSNGKIVEVVSRFMPRKRNVPSRDWVCNLADGTCIDENQLEYIDESIEGLDEAAEDMYPSNSWKEGKVAKHITNLHCQDAFKAGAEWQKKQMLKEAVEGTITCYNDETYSVGSCCFDNKEHHYHSGDKVRVIVLLKEDEK